MGKETSFPTIQDLERKIRELIVQINALIEMKEKLEQERRSHPSFVQPFHRLPTELLAEIAIHYVEMGGSPARLNQICSSMRQAVNETKKLWTQITINQPPLPKKYIKDPKQDDAKGVSCSCPSYLELVLKRAAPLPVEIFFDKVITNADLQVLSSYSNVIKTLEIIGAKEQDRILDLSLPFLSLTNISHFELVWEDLPMDTIIQFLDMVNCSQAEWFHLSLKLTTSATQVLQHPVFTRVPNLKLDFAVTQFGLEPLAFPMVRDLILTGFVDGVWSALRVPTLSHLEIYMCREIVQPRWIPASVDYFRLSQAKLWKPLEPYELRKLTCLVLVDVDMHFPLTSSFEMPNLEELVISRVNDRTIINPDDRSYGIGLFPPITPLKRLHLDGLRPARGGDVPFWAFPNILSLRITSCAVNYDNLVRKLVHPSCTSQLEEVVIYNIYDTDGLRIDTQLVIQDCAAERPSLTVCDEYPPPLSLKHKFWSEGEIA